MSMVAFFRFGSLFAIAVIAAATQAESRYSLSTLESGFRPIDLNDAGQVAGNVIVNGVNKAALYSNGFYTSLRRSSPFASAAVAINAKGEVLVNSSDNIGGSRIWRGAVETSLGHWQAEAMSSSGVVLGTNFREGQIFYDNGTLKTLPWPAGAVIGHASVISDTGRFIAGDATYSVRIPENGYDYRTRAYLIENGVATDLGTLGGYNSSVTAVNDSGQAIGSSEDEPHYLKRKAFLYENGQMKDLGSLGGGPTRYSITTSASDINNRGQVVGWSSVPAAEGEFNQAGFLYEDGQMKNLNDLLDVSGTGWNVTGASTINNQGMILAFATSAQFGAQPVLLRPLASPTPVPEPASMLALGLGAATMLRRRRRKS